MHIININKIDRLSNVDDENTCAREEPTESRRQVEVDGDRKQHILSEMPYRMSGSCGRSKYGRLPPLTGARWLEAHISAAVGVSGCGIRVVPRDQTRPFQGWVFFVYLHME